MERAEQLAWLRLIRSEHVGPLTFYQLLSSCGSASAALERLPEFAKRGGSKRQLTAYPLAEAERELAAVEAFGARMLCRDDARYPEALKQLADAPPVLFYKGHLELLQKPVLAIVGARNASVNGCRMAAKLAGELGAKGHVVASGLARGIDAAAHQAALSTGTVAVLGCGINIVFPKENAALAGSIAEHGLLVTEQPFGAEPMAQHFPRRNRIISGLSEGVVVVEATLRSGSLGTARLAAEQGREVFAVPGFPMDPRAEGPNTLISEGAVLVQKTEDILNALRPYAQQAQLLEAQQPVYMPPEPQEAQDLQKRIEACLSATPVSLDEVIDAVGAPAGLIQGILLEMELAGRLLREPGNRLSLICDAP